MIKELLSLRKNDFENYTHEQDLFWMTVTLVKIKVTFRLPVFTVRTEKKSTWDYLSLGFLRETPAETKVVHPEKRNRIVNI